MPYLGQAPTKGDENNFKILDNISSYTLTFDGSDAAVVSAANDTITSLTHRFVQGQRVTYNKGGGTVITGLSDGVYYIIKHDHNTIKLATSASNATNGIAVNITGVGAGSSHTLNVAFDGVNTKFKATHTNGQKANITRSAQLVISINGVIQQPHDSTAPSTGFGFDLDGTIVFSQAPVAGDVYWAHVLTNNNVTFDISDNHIDRFTGNASTTAFNLSKSPPDNRNVLVTIDGVVQYPNDPDGTVRAYNVVENVLTFTSAPIAGAEIQVRHIGFAGAASGGGGVTNFYGRTGAVVLKNTDNIVANNAEFAGNLTVQGTMTTLDTKVTEVDQLEVAANNTTVGAAITQTGSGQGLLVHADTNYKGILVNGTNAPTVSFAKGTDTTPVWKIGLSGSDPDNLAFGTGAGNSNQFRLLGAGGASLLGTLTAEHLGIDGHLYHNGDTNTKLLFGTDTIDLQTAGSTRLRAENTGVIITGVTTVSASAHISNANGSVFFGAGSATAYGSQGGIGRASNANYHIGGSAVGDFCIAAEGSKNILFGTKTGTGIGGILKRVTIASGGYVGIGSAAPAALLNLMSNNPLIRLTDSDNGAYSTIGGEGGNLYLYTNSSTRDFIFRGSSEVARLTGDGMLGIGTHTPGQALHLIDDKKIALGQGQDLQLYHSGSSSSITNSTGNLNIVGAVGHKIDIKDGAAYYIRCNSTNSVELFYNGGSKFSTKDYGATLNGNMRVTTGGSGYTFITDNDSGMHNPSDGNLHFKVNGVDRFSMNNSGISTFYNNQLHIEGAGSGNTPLTINTDVASNNSVHPLIEGYSDNASHKTQIGLVRDGSSGALGWAFSVSNAGSTEEALRITSSGKVCIAHTNALHSGNLQVSTTGADAIDINSYSTSADNGGRLSFYRSKNASIGSNTIVADDDSLGRIDFRGYNTSGNSYNQGATIEARVDGSVNSSTDMPSAILFKTSADGSASPTERLRITSAGNVGINSTTPRGKLDIKFAGAPNYITFGSDADNPKMEWFRSTGGSPSHYATEIQMVLGDLVLSTAATANLGSHSYEEKLRINSGGRIIIGHSQSSGDLHGPQGTTGRNPLIQLHGANTSNAGLGLISWKNSAGAYYAPTLYLAHSGSDTIGTNGILPANGEFGSIVFSGDDGTDFVKGAMIKARLDGTPGNDDMPGRLEFYTTPDGAQAPEERLRIDSAGRCIVGGGTHAGGSALVVKGGNQNTYSTIGMFSNHTNPANNTALTQIRFGSNVSAVGADIRATADAAWGNNDYPTRLGFYTAPDGSNSRQERLRIDNQGNVKTGTVASALNFTDSNSGNTKSIEVGATSGGDALLVTHSSGYGVGYFGYEAGGDRLIIATDNGGGNNKIDFITDAGTSTGGGTDNLNAKVPKMRIAADGKVGINNSDPQTTLNVKGTISTGRNVAREVGTATASTSFNSSRDGENVISGQKNYEAGGGDWLTPGYSRDNAYVTIDLGANYNISRAVIYNQNEYVNSRRECKGFTLEASTDNSNWTTVISDELGRSNGHEPNPGWSFRIPSIFNDDDEFYTARYWKFTMLTFHGSDPYGGINEIELYEHSDTVTDEVTSASVVAGDIYAETAAFKRITHDGGQKINMDNAGANGVDAGMSLGLDGSNSFFALGQVGESGYPMIYKTYRINSPGNGLSATHVLMEADSNTNAIVMNGILTIFPGRAGYNQQRGFIQYGINYSAYSGSLYGDHYELHRHGVTGYSNLAIVKSGLKVQLEVTSNTAAVGRIHMIWQGQLYNHRHNY